MMHAMRKHHIVIHGLPHSTIFSTLSHQEYDLKTKIYGTQNVCFDFLYNFRLKHFSFQEEMSETQSKMYIGLHVKYPLF
jgi:hypothetical protein